MTQEGQYSELAAILAASLDLQQPPVAISFTGAVPAGVKMHTGRVPAGCKFWEDGASTAFATSAVDHNLCAIGVTRTIFSPLPPNRPTSWMLSRCSASLTMCGQKTWH